MRCLPLVLIAVSSAVFAQEDDELDTTVAVPGMQMNVNMKVRQGGPGAAPAAAPSKRAAPGGQPVGDVAVECAPMNGVRSKTIKFTGLEGAAAQVYAEDGSLAGQYTLPFNFEGRGDTYYRFLIQGADGSTLLDRKLEVKQYVGCLAKLGGGGRRAPGGGGSPAAGAGGMSSGDFAALLEAVNDAGFADDKLGVIATAAQSAQFTVSQVGQLIEAISMSSDKLKALQLLKGTIVDRQNNFRLLEKFTFSADKAKAQAMLK